MRSLELGKHRKARVWINQLPDASFVPSVVAKVVISTDGTSGQGNIQAAIELFIPLGPRAMYGLLGARFVANQSGELIIEIGSTELAGDVVPDTLAMRGDIVRVGLPSEYINGVSNGIELALPDLAKLGAGVMTVSCAAYAEISSCEDIYSKVFRMLAALLSVGDSSMSDEILIAAMTKALS